MLDLDKPLLNTNVEIAKCASNSINSSVLINKTVLTCLKDHATVNNTTTCKFATVEFAQDCKFDTNPNSKCFFIDMIKNKNIPRIVLDNCFYLIKLKIARVLFISLFFQL